MALTFILFYCLDLLLMTKFLKLLYCLFYAIINGNANHLLSVILGLGIIMGMQTIYKSAILGFGTNFFATKQKQTIY